MKLSINIILLTFFIVEIIISCSKSDFEKNAIIKFPHKEYDFKQLEIGQKAEYDFEFSNPGKTPLVIQNVKTSCGCTVPEWTKEPVKPDKKGKISIKYDTFNPGTFSKSITVYYNGKDSPAHLKIRGTVKLPNE